MMALKITYEKLAPLLVILLTISLPFLHFDISRRYNYQIALAELFIIFIAILAYKKDLFLSLPYESTQFKLIVLLLMTAILSTALSPSISLAVMRFFAIFIWILFFWLMNFLICTKRLSAEVLIIAGAFSSLLPLIVICFAHIINDQGNTWMETFEGLGLYSNIRHLGYHLTASCLLSFYFLLNSSFNFKRLAVGMALISTYFSALLITGSRQGILITSLFLAILLAFYYRRHWGKIIVLLLVGASTLIATVYFGGGENLLLHLYERSSLEGLTSNRTKIWLTSLDHIGWYWPLGYGPEAFVALRKSMGIKTFVHPHSIVVQSLLEWGIIGSLIYFSILYRSLSKSFRKINFKHLPSTSAALVIAFFTLCGLLANALIDGTFYHVLPIYFASIAFAILCATSDEIHSQAE